MSVDPHRFRHWQEAQQQIQIGKHWREVQVRSGSAGVEHLLQSEGCSTKSASMILRHHLQTQGCASWRRRIGDSHRLISKLHHDQEMTLAWKSDLYNSAHGIFTQHYDIMLSHDLSGWRCFLKTIREACWPPSILNNYRQDKHFVLGLKPPQSLATPLPQDELMGYLEQDEAKALINSIRHYYASKLLTLGLVSVGIAGIVFFAVK